MPALYNEIEPFAVEWTRELIKAGHVAPGVVETRSISDLTPEEVSGHVQFHTFSGIAVWSHALREAGWDDDAEVWTGSCPCQPLSTAGRKKGFEDARHLWPDWFKLIRECRPPVIFGEQVASPLGLQWLDLVRADLEGAGYAFAASDLCAAGVGAPHIRQRLYFVAIADGERLEGVRVHLRQRRSLAAVSEARGRGAVGVVADDAGAGRESRRGLGEPSDGRGPTRFEPGRLRHARRVADDGGAGPQGRDAGAPGRDGSARDLEDGRVDDAAVLGQERRPGTGRQTFDRSQFASGASGVDDARGAGSRRDAGAVSGPQGEGAREREEFGCVLDVVVPPGPTRGYWEPADWVLCRDGKARPVEPGAFPLANGAAARMGRLRGYGNAIVGPLAQAFIESVIDILVAE